MRYFTDSDLMHATEAMLSHGGSRDVQFMGTISGIKRRARARAILEFAAGLRPPPPDESITSMRAVLRELFGRGVSTDDLHRHFATPGRKADDRVDMTAFRAWLDEHRERFSGEAAALLAALDGEWKLFTVEAARRAGKLRKAEAVTTRQPQGKKR